MKKKGPSSARNIGISIANGEYFIFIDIDCLADKNMVYNHIKAHLDFKDISNNKVIGGGIGGYNKSFWAICDDFCSWSNYHPSLKNNKSLTHFPTANMSIPRRLIDEVGLFNEQKLIGEDVDFCLRATEKGYMLYFMPEAKVCHINRTTFKGFMDHARSWAKSETLLELNSIQRKCQLIKLLKYLYKYLCSVIKIVYNSFTAKRFHVIFFIPFIILHKTYFGYHKLKYGKEISKHKN